MSKELDREAFSNLVRALAFASRKHSQQRRKDVDASPYINHPSTARPITSLVQPAGSRHERRPPEPGC